MPKTCTPLRLTPVLAAVAATVAALLTTGCAAPGRIDAQTPPDDFVLGVTVYAQPSESPIAGRVDPSLPRGLQPGRYVIEADGVLRAATGPAADPSVFPPRTRQLSAAQMDEVWRLTRDAGVFAAASLASEPSDQSASLSVAVGSPVLYEPPPEHVTALIEAFAAGERGTRAFILDGDSPSAHGAGALTDYLADLAWIPRTAVDVERSLRARQPAGE